MNTMKSVFKTTLTSLVAATLTFSAAYAKEKPPVGAEPANFQLPKTHTITLPNGLDVTFIPYGKTPKVTVRLVTKTGNIDDGDHPWLADISYDMLRQGTQTVSAKQQAENVASMGGQVQSSVGADVSWIGMDVLSEFGDEAVATIADMILNARMADGDLQRLKTDNVRQLKVSMSQAGSLASQAFYKEVFGNHPYGEIYPTEQSLNAITQAMVKSFVSANVTPNRSHLYISGVFDQDEIAKQAQQAFGQWKMGEKKQANRVITQTGPKIKMIERAGSPQSTIRLGVAAVGPEHPDALQLAMMNTILGGAFSSRITSNIREDKGYTYSPNSSVSNRVGAGVWMQSADITIESTGAALTEIFKEIDLLSNTPPSKAELEGIKNYMSGIFVLQNSSRGAIIAQLVNMDVHQLSADHLDTYVARIHSTTPEQISAIAKKYLTPEKMTLVVVGDKANVEPQLKAVQALKGYW